MKIAVFYVESLKFEEYTRKGKTLSEVNIKSAKVMGRTLRSVTDPGFPMRGAPTPN